MYFRLMSRSEATQTVSLSSAHHFVGSRKESQPEVRFECTRSSGLPSTLETGCRRQF